MPWQGWARHTVPLPPGLGGLPRLVFRPARLVLVGKPRRPIGDIAVARRRATGAEVGPVGSAAARERSEGWPGWHRERAPESAPQQAARSIHHVSVSVSNLGLVLPGRVVALSTGGVGGLLANVVVRCGAASSCRIASAFRARSATVSRRRRATMARRSYAGRTAPLARTTGRIRRTREPDPGERADDRRRAGAGRRDRLRPRLDRALDLPLPLRHAASQGAFPRPAHSGARRALAPRDYPGTAAGRRGVAGFRGCRSSCLSQRSRAPSSSTSLAGFVRGAL